ncbi:MAG TPA: amidase [Ohtaekwangia sp.]|uniref:amidase n=1 Tax=Ohtaekwangia sp. TaxID=2066019 RepID=UPI002F9210AE
MKRLLMLLMLVGVLACDHKTNTADKPPAIPAYLEEITIRQLQQGYKDGKYTITGVVRDYLARIEALDKNGPQINSIICINPDALPIAEALEKEWKEGKIRGPLHGIPIILKDNIDTHDKMPNTAGAIVLRNSFPSKDSEIARKLREAGAIILGKANLSEWANFRADMSSSGWSGVGGQTKNPYVLDRNPCGSSAGSGAAVAANLCALAIGTETNGSIVCPSNNNGIVGLKPTVGLLSRSGIIPISFTQDTPGPMGRTVEDVAITLGALVGKDTADSKTLDPAAVFHTDYTPFLKADGLKGKRIGLLKDVAGFHAKVDTLMKQVVIYLKQQGAEVIEIAEPVGKGAGGPSFQVLLYEFKDGLNKYFASLPSAPVHNLEELMAFNKKDSVELRYFDQKLLEMANAKGDLKSKEYIESLAAMHKATRTEGIDKVMQQYTLDALMAPTGSPAWKTDLIDGDHFLGGSSSLAAIAGYPSIAVPMGFVDELPVDVSFFGKAWSESVLIEIAYAYEQGTRHRKAPKYIPSNGSVALP